MTSPVKPSEGTDQGPARGEEPRDPAVELERLTRSEQLYRDLVEGQGLGIGEMDEDERFLYANRAGHEIFGVPPGALVGHTLKEFTDPVNFAAVKQQTALRKSGVLSTYRLEIQRLDGVRRTIMITSTPKTDASGRFLAALGVFRDVTEELEDEERQRRLEERMLQAQKLESLGVLAGGIAHDFNNIMAVILGNASYALGELSPEHPLFSCIDEIQQAGRRAAELTKQMLAYAGRGRFQLQPVQLSQAVSSLSRLLAASISKKCSLRFQLADELPLIEADADQISQVILNLAVNAGEAIGEATGVIELRTSLLSCGRAVLADAFLAEELSAGEYVALQISDDGHGITPEVRRRIFDPFFSTKFTGRGLGLPAVLGIIRAHRGAIKVDSQPGVGTTVTVLFPPASKLAAELEPGGEPSRGTVLVIDDEAGVRSMLQRILSRQGYRLLLAGDGAQGVALYREHAEEIALVLLDLAMPEMSGPQVFEELRRLSPTVRVLLTSGYDERDARRRFKLAEGASFLQKPYSRETLLEVVERALATPPTP